MALSDNDNKNINTSNIFDEFNDNPWLNDEIKEIIKSQKKDFYYYVDNIWHYLQVIFWLFLLILPIFFAYIYIQENESISNNNLIDPFCFLFTWNIENTNTYCSSISSLKKDYLAKLANVKNTQVSEINSTIEYLYKIENFNVSKDIIFLREKARSKLPVLKILSEFDDLKNQFEPIEKEKISCFDIEISNEYIFKANCIAYSAWFDKQIKWFDWTDNNLVSWKSMSYANSFLNFIEKQSSNFVLINKQKIFSQENLLWETTWFTNKTSFTLELKYKSNNLF